MPLSLHRPIPARAAIPAVLLTWVVATVPLWFATFPPLHDYPFHIARIFILDRWSGSETLQTFYSIGSFLLPNVGMDLVTLLLSQVFPVPVAGRIFVGLTLGLMLSGCVALHHSLFRRFSLWPLASALFLFNWILLFGFLNYLFGLGVMLWAAAIWVRLAGRAVWLRIACGTGLSLALFFSHFVALGVFALIVAGYELQRFVLAWRTAGAAPAGGAAPADAAAAGRTAALRDLLAGAAIFVLPLLLFARSSTAGEAGSTIDYGDPWYLWKPFMLYRTLMAGNWLLDHLLVAAVIAAAVVVVLRGRVRLAPAMRLPLAVLAAAFLVLPNYLFRGWFIDARLPVAIVFVAIAATEVRLRSPAWDRILVAGLALLLVVRAGVLANDWSRSDRIIGEFVAAFDRLPPHSMVFSLNAGGYPSEWALDLRYWRPSVEHVVSLAILDRPVFVPAIWADPSQQPIRVNARFRDIYTYQDHGSHGSWTLEKFVQHTTALRRLAAAASPGGERSAWPVVFLLLYPDLLRYELPPGTTILASGSRFLLLTVEDGAG